jgi:hypothetical protein
VAAEKSARLATKSPPTGRHGLPGRREPQKVETRMARVTRPLTEIEFAADSWSRVVTERTSNTTEPGRPVSSGELRLDLAVGRISRCSERPDNR